MTVTAQKAAPASHLDSALLSIGFLMDMMEHMLWRSGGGRGPWEACLAALVLAYDPACKPRKLLEALPAEKKMDKTGFLNTMVNLGYFSSSMPLVLGEVERRLLPCLFLRSGDENTPCIVLTRNDEGITIYDSTRHKIETIPSGSALEKTKGEIYFFLPYDHHLQTNSKFMREGSGLTWFRALIRRFSATFYQILIACFALNLFALAPSLFVMFVYDRIISPTDLSSLPALTIGVFIALTAEYVLRGVRSEGLSWMTARLDNLIEQASVAAQVARIKTFESVRDFFSSAVFLSFLEIPFVLISVAVMGAIAGPLVFVPLAMIGSYIALFAIMRSKIKRAIRLAAKTSSARQQFTIETFEKLRSVRVNGLTKAWNRKFEDLTGRETLMNFHMGFLGTVAETVANGLTILSAVMTIGFGTHLIWAGEMTTGALVASMIIVWRILLPFYSLCTMIPRLEQLRNSVEQVNTLMELETETDKAAAVLPALRGEIAIDNATLSYDGSKDPVINDCNLHLFRGTVTAITGRNGTGKSSLLKMVKGLYRPQSGAVRIDGFDIRQLDALELRRQISYVPQKPDFFPGTVIENILIGNPFAAIQDVELALQRAEAWEEIQALPEGLETQVRRGMFSASLAARLSLARAYLHNAPILLIDELPHAVMNGPAGQNLRQYLLQGKAVRTALIVTYRGDMIDSADMVIQMVAGETPHITIRGENTAPPKTSKEAA